MVTGGAGYLGSTLVPMLLAAGYEVTVVDTLRFGGTSLLGSWAHPDFRLVKADITETSSLSDVVSDQNAIVHLAAIVGDPACAREPERAITVNINATRDLALLAKSSGVSQFIFASTCSNYGKMGDSADFLDEDAPLDPVSLYAESKVASENTLAELASDAFGVTVLRFSTLFGTSPRMRFDLTVNEFSRDLYENRRLEVYGEQFWRPYVHVRDAANAILMNLGSELGREFHVFNVGSNSQNFRKRDIVEMITSIVPGCEITRVEKTEDPRDYRVSFDRIADDLGYHTTLSVENGIREIVELVESGIVDSSVLDRSRN